MLLLGETSGWGTTCEACYLFLIFNGRDVYTYIIWCDRNRNVRSLCRCWSLGYRGILRRLLVLRLIDPRHQYQCDRKNECGPDRVSPDLVLHQRSATTKRGKLPFILYVCMYNICMYICYSTSNTLNTHSLSHNSSLANHSQKSHRYRYYHRSTTWDQRRRRRFRNHHRRTRNQGRLRPHTIT